MKVVMWALMLTVIVFSLGMISTAEGRELRSNAEPEEEVRSILSFEAWKSRQIEAAQVTYDVANVDQKLQQRSANGVSPSPARGSARVEQARLNLEVAKELGLQDYFVLYVTRIEKPEDFQRLAEVLTPEQTAALLGAYARELLEGGDGGDERSAVLVLSE